MNVRELIDKLTKFEPDAEVQLCSPLYTDNFVPIGYVKDKLDGRCEIREGKKYMRFSHEPRNKDYKLHQVVIIF